MRNVIKCKASKSGICMSKWMTNDGPEKAVILLKQKKIISNNYENDKEGSRPY